MSDLLNKLKKVGTITDAMVLAESEYFNDRDFIKTKLPILNIAFSGDVDHGLASGVTVLAGASKSFKSMLGLYCMRAYLDKYEDAIALYYDSEYGTTPEYVSNIGVDTSRVLHLPTKTVEELKFDLTKKLQEIKKGEHVFIFVDSIGALPSMKEIEDAVNEKSVAEMQRAKQIKSLFRLITPEIATKDIPGVFISHTYQTMEMYSKAVVSGGTGQVYSANNIFIITKSQEKQGDEIVGWNFTINIEKSRFVKEKSKLTFTVLNETGISYYSGILELALESGHVAKPSNGWYQMVDKSSGELVGTKIRAAQTANKEFLGKVLADETFKEFVREKYKLKNTLKEIDAIDFSDDGDDDE
jgi:RecA/RadA recombinase